MDGIRQPGAVDRVRVPVDDELGDTHPVGGERAGLVDAQDGHRAERLDDGRPAREDLLARHAERAEREEDGQDDRVLLGQHRHRRCDPCEEPLEPAASDRTEREHDDDDGSERDRRDDAHEPVDLELQWRPTTPESPERTADHAELAASTGRPHDGRAVPAHDQRP